MKLKELNKFQIRILILIIITLQVSCKNNSDNEANYTYSQETEAFMKEPSTKIFISAYSWAISSKLIPTDSKLLSEFIEMSSDSISDNTKMEYANIFRRLVNDNYNKQPEKRKNLDNYKTYYRTEINRDSSEYYFKKGKENYSNREYSKAIKNFDNTLRCYPINYEAKLYKGKATKEAKKFDDAIWIFNSILRDTQIKNIDKNGLKIEVAKCYKLFGDKLLSKGQKEDAIIQYSIAAHKGNNSAKLKYERLNPVIQEIIGYRTKCCDGSYSDARSEGACSHHGGVCDWNEPIYKEHRKYE